VRGLLGLVIHQDLCKCVVAHAWFGIFELTVILCFFSAAHAASSLMALHKHESAQESENYLVSAVRIVTESYSIIIYIHIYINISPHDFLVFVFPILTNSAYHTWIEECGTLTKAGH
jgi:hypothetical protein